MMQTNPKLKQVSKNMDLVNKWLPEVEPCPNHPSVIMLPELSFTGYNFRSRAEISGFLETADGPTVQWAKEAARSFQSHILVGFPEKDGNHIYNSCALVAPDRSVLTIYRKSHLFRTDKIWGCSESPEGFKCVGPFPTLPFKVQLAICMDVNPRQSSSPFWNMELANSIAENESELVLIPCAWLKTPDAIALTKPDNELVKYWRQRIPNDVFIAICNRTGIERDAHFAGTSTIFQRNRTFSLPIKVERMCQYIGFIDKGDREFKSCTDISLSELMK